MDTKQPYFSSTSSMFSSLESTDARERDGSSMIVHVACTGFNSGTICQTVLTIVLWYVDNSTKSTPSLSVSPQQCCYMKKISIILFEYITAR